MRINLDHIPPRKLRILKFLFFGLLVYFALFYKLGSNPLEIWDESLFAIRALHLFETGSYLSNFDNYPDLTNHRNTKLPFTTFFQVLGYKIFGINELAVRVPVVSILVATLGYLIYHFRSVFHSENTGLLLGFIVITTTGLYGPHMARSGDHDMAFGCYLLLSTIFFGNFLTEKNTRSLVYFTIVFTAAIMTKNLLAGLIFPGIFIYTLVNKQLLQCLRDYRIYVSIATIFAIYCGSLWYYEWQYDGFIERMWNYELMGRYQTNIEGHKGPLYYYFMEIVNKFNPYYILLLVSLAVSFHPQVGARKKQAIHLMSAAFLSYILIISFSETKTFWYLAPCYLFSAYISALGCLAIGDIVKITKSNRFRVAMITAILIVALSLYVPIVLNNAHYKRELQKSEKYGVYLEKLLPKLGDISTITLIDNNFGTGAFFYKKKYEDENPHLNITYQRSPFVNDGTHVVTCLNNVFNPIRTKYDYEVLDKWTDCQLLFIKSNKSHELNQTQD